MSSATDLRVEIHRFKNEPEWTYALLDEYQRGLIDGVVKRGEPGRVILSEIAPTVTLTQRTPDEDLLLPKMQIAERGVTVAQTDRGGLATYHGPGQWIVYWIESLERLTGDRRGVRQAVETLVDVGVRAAEGLGLEGVHARDGDERGVWTSEGKLASVGIRVTQGVLLHGLCFNVFPTRHSFTGIRPCGLNTTMVYSTPDEPGTESEQDEWMERAGKALTHSVREIWSERRSKSP